MNIPFVSCSTNRHGFCASFGLSLFAICPAALLSAHEAHSFDEVWNEQHERTIKLLGLLSRWPAPCSLELRILSHPSLDAKVSARNEVILLFHCLSSHENSALEQALKRYVELNAVLAALWPMAEWQPLERGQFQHSMRPLDPGSGVLVGRDRRVVDLAQPFASLKLPIGFQASSDRLEGESGESRLIDYLFPWIPASSESWGVLFETLMGLPTPRWVILRLVIDGDASTRAGELMRLTSATDACDRFLSVVNSSELTLGSQARWLREACLRRSAQLRDGAFCGAVLVLSPGEPDFPSGAVLGQSITGDHSRRQSSSFFEGGFALRTVDPHLAMDPFEVFGKETLSLEESSCFFRLPQLPGDRDLGLPVRRSRIVELQRLPPNDSPSRIQLGVNVHSGISHPIEIEIEDRMHHMLCIGASGVGKSTMLCSCMLQDARAGRGFALIDPPGELADEFLARFPKDRVEDLIIVDLEDREFPVPLNLLAAKTKEEQDLIIDTLYDACLGIYRNPEWFGPMFERYFRGGLKLLLGAKVPKAFIPTLLEFPMVFTHAPFRKYLRSRLSEEESGDAIAEAERVTSSDYKIENMAPYINSKLTRFYQDSLLRRVVGDGRMVLDFREIMDSGKIVVFKLAQGRLGKHISEILMGQIIARFRLAAMSRADIPPKHRKSFFLYVDECQVLGDGIGIMLSQCRKYSLGLIIAHQYTSQLRERGVLDAVLGNVGTVAAYRVGVEDARLLEPIFAPTIGAMDLVECQNWNGYMRLHSNRGAVRPFSFQTVPDGTASDPEWARELREQNRLRWAVSAEEIDRRIKSRRQFVRNLAKTSSPKCPHEAALELPLPDDEVLSQER